MSTVDMIYTVKLVINFANCKLQLYIFYFTNSLIIILLILKCLVYTLEIIKIHKNIKIIKQNSPDKINDIYIESNDGISG